MKTIYTYFFIILFTLLAKLTLAQYMFPKYKATVQHTQCNYSTLGSITITIDTSKGPYTYKWSNASQTNTINNLIPGSYTVLITNKNKVDTSATYIINEPACELKGDVVFTPNADGYKDTWGISNVTYYPNAWILVYNRLGQKVFEQNGAYKPWDGKDLLGTPVPEGTYYYIIYKNKSENKITKGSVSILR